MQSLDESETEADTNNAFPLPDTFACNFASHGVSRTCFVCAPACPRTEQALNKHDLRRGREFRPRRYLKKACISHASSSKWQRRTALTRQSFIHGVQCRA
eukprot:6178009-Pleurochrysis_carterae.AAC.1